MTDLEQLAARVEAGVTPDKLREWADDFEAAARGAPRGIKRTVLATRAEECRLAAQIFAAAEIARLRAGAGEEGKLVKRPVSYRVNAHGNWLYFDDEQIASESAEMHGVDYQALYVRDGTPLNFAAPPALALPSVESAQEIMAEIGLIVGEWRSSPELSASAVNRVLALFQPSSGLHQTPQIDNPSSEDDTKGQSPVPSAQERG